MGRTQSQHAETARELTLVSTFRLGLAAAVCLLCVATCVAADDTPPKTEKSDDASASLKSSGSASKGEPSAKAAKQSEKPGEKSWASDSSAAPKPTVHRPRPNVNLKDSAAVAAAVDKMILQNLTESGTQPAPRTSDEDFLRRIHFDLAGTVPSAREVTLFGLEPDPQKRDKLIERLLASEEYAHNWAEYWRDVIFLRATDMRGRIIEGVFEKWMSDQIRENRGWDKIVTSLLTASGPVNEHGETALIFAHAGQADEIAAETSRIFLGIQIQCANCHDHPNDKWKRQQFHQLAAFFPRVTVRRMKGSTDPRAFEVASYDDPAGNGKGPGKGKGKKAGDFLEHPERLFARFDRNHDGKITKAEVKGTQFEKAFDRLLANADANKDGALTIKEIKEMPAPGGNKRPTAEHFMADLKNPSSKGTKMEPIFFVNGKRPKSGLPDEERRHALAKYLTADVDPWFSRAYVNRIWSEMVGEGFYMPIDDMGPQRQARMPEVLDLLADAWVANKYDMQWLFRTIARTETYQREIRPKDPSVESPPVFASSVPKRLRADQLFNAITKVLGIEGVDPKESEGVGGGYKKPGRNPRAQFSFLFGYDPSTAPDDLTGNVPQALFMMNSRLINSLIHAQGKTRLATILEKYSDNKDAVREVYVLTLAREPSEKEEQVCLNYVKDVGNRHEGFEDVMWSLMNSSEFLSKR
ncbi:MAG TPA: DUF1549 domain-containing protein [Planctomycetaceae bacterium]|jgi:hypothetical protein|nr:DUF1549 domain-containing protein [Planctomycetaceae bacterium]